MASTESKPVFQGFPQTGIAFLEQLRDNNNRDWFQDNKSVFKESLEAPAKAFLEEMKVALEDLVKGDVKGKIFRIYRDVRFSKDKTPYNPYLRLSFTRDSEGRDCGAAPSFFLSLEPDELVLGCGLFEFNKELLNTYREAVMDNQEGSQLSTILSNLEGQGFRVSEPGYKKIPRGYDKAHERADLLRHKGLAIWDDHNPPAKLTTAEAIPFCLTQYQKMKPLYNWLQNLSAAH